jgi:hypothetical protein
VEEVLRRAEEGDFDDPDVGMDAGEWKDANGNGTGIAEEGVYSTTRTTHPAAAADDDEIEEGELDESSEVQNEAETNDPHGSSHQPQPTTRTIIGPQLPHPTGSTSNAGE